MKIVAVTGNVASGKSTISKMIADSYNLIYISVDDFSRKCISLYEYEFKQIAREWGYNTNDDLREVLKTHIFKDRFFRERVQDTVHRYFWDYMKTVEHYAEYFENKHILIEHPLLFEMADYSEVDFVIGVHADYDSRVDRMLKRGYSEERIKDVVNSQTPLSPKRCDVCLDNTNFLTIERIKNELDRTDFCKKLLS